MRGREGWGPGHHGVSASGECGHQWSLFSHCFCLLSESEHKAVDGLGENGKERLAVWGERRRYMPATQKLFSSYDKQL